MQIFYERNCGSLERFSCNLDVKTREQNRNNKRTEIERNEYKHAWLLVGQAKARVKKLHARELSRNQPILRFDVEQCLLHTGFSLAGKRGVHVLIFSSIG